MKETIREKMCHAVDLFQWVTGTIPQVVYISPASMVKYISEMSDTERISPEKRKGHGLLCFYYSEYTITILANPFLLDDTAMCDWVTDNA